MILEHPKLRISSIISLGLGSIVAVWPVAKFLSSPDQSQVLLMLASLPACLVTGFSILLIGRFASEPDAFSTSNVKRLSLAGKLFLLAGPLLLGGHVIARAFNPDLGGFPPMLGLAGAFLAGIGACSIFLSSVVAKGLSLKQDNEGFI